MTRGDNPTPNEYEVLKNSFTHHSPLNRTQPMKLLSFVKLKLNNMMVNPLTASTHASEILHRCVIFTTRTKRSQRRLSRVVTLPVCDGRH